MAAVANQCGREAALTGGGCGAYGVSNHARLRQLRGRRMLCDSLACRSAPAAMAVAAAAVNSEGDGDASGGGALRQLQ